MTARKPLVMVSGVPCEIPAGDVLSDATGTSFPGSPGTGDKFYRSDRSIEYYYDGTRWLSTELFTLNFAPTDFTLPITGTKTAGFRTANPWYNKYDFYMIDAIFARFPFSTTASTWTFKIVKSNSSSTSDVVSQAAASDTNNVWNATRTAANSVITSDYIAFDGAATLNSGSVSTGEYVLFAFTYRLVG